jgi:O-antigen ligase
LSNGIDTRRIRLYIVVVVGLFTVYVFYSAAQFSLQGFRNAVALFAVSSVFLFFFRASNLLMESKGFLIALIIAFGSFVFLWHMPFSVAKNNINGAMCYYLIAAFLCLSRCRNFSTSQVAMLFIMIFVISALNRHRTLAGASVLLLLQYFILNRNVYRVQLRGVMFVGLVGVVAGTIALLVDPKMTAFATAFNTLVTSEGGRTLMSGRQILWPAVWQAFEANPVFGMGPATVPGDLYSTTLSAHNLYLQIGLQLGFVGFGFLLLLFWSLWRATRPVGLPSTWAAENLMTVVVTMVIVHSLFGVFLFQNALVIGVPVWMVLGIGLGALSRESAKIRAARRHARDGAAQHAVVHG